MNRSFLLLMIHQIVLFLYQTKQAKPMELQEIKTAIQSWNGIRAHADQTLIILETGHYFKISKAMYEFWKGRISEEEMIHAYLGVVVDENDHEKINFFLIDQKADENPEFTQADIKIADFHYGFEENQSIPRFENIDEPDRLTISIALERGFRWMINRKSYIEKTVNPEGGNSGLFQVLHFKRSDLDHIFADENASEAIVVFGMKDDVETGVLTPELLLWSDSFHKHEIVADVAFPIPPFSNENHYQLLKAALPNE